MEVSELNAVLTAKNAVLTAKLVEMNKKYDAVVKEQDYAELALQEKSLAPALEKHREILNQLSKLENSLLSILNNDSVLKYNFSLNYLISDVISICILHHNHQWYQTNHLTY